MGKEYDTDTKAADKKYEGKTLEVTGTVSKVDTFVLRPYVGLVGSKNIFGIRGYTTEKQPWANFAPGQKVKIVGTYESSGSLNLRKCEVTAIDPNPAIKATAETLAKEFEDDANAAKKKYANKTLIISGTVKSVEGRLVEIKGAGKTHLLIRVDEDRPKAGDATTLVGPFELLDGNYIVIGSSLPVKK